MQLNAIENAKIECCTQLFKEMSTDNVKYNKVGCYQDLIDVGKGKGYAQIADRPYSFVLADDIETGLGNKFPLWLLGFLY